MFSFVLLCLFKLFSHFTRACIIIIEVSPITMIVIFLFQQILSSFISTSVEKIFFSFFSLGKKLLKSNLTVIWKNCCEISSNFYFFFSRQFAAFGDYFPVVTLKIVRNCRLFFKFYLFFLLLSFFYLQGIN